MKESVEQKLDKPSGNGSSKVICWLALSSLMLSSVVVLFVLMLFLLMLFESIWFDLHLLRCSRILEMPFVSYCKCSFLCWSKIPTCQHRSLDSLSSCSSLCLSCYKCHFLSVTSVILAAKPLLSHFSQSLHSCGV